MKVQIKSTLLLMGTLLVGIVLGMILHETFLVRHFQSRTHQMRDPQRFIHHFEEIIQPTDAQREEIKKILKKHYNKMMSERRIFEAKMDSLRTELESVLTEEQKVRLKNSHLLKQNRQPRRHFRKEPPYPHRPGHEPFMDGPPPTPPPDDDLIK